MRLNFHFWDLILIFETPFSFFSFDPRLLRFNFIFESWSSFLIPTDHHSISNSHFHNVNSIGYDPSKIFFYSSLSITFFFFFFNFFWSCPSWHFFLMLSSHHSISVSKGGLVVRNNGKIDLSFTYLWWFLLHPSSFLSPFFLAAVADHATKINPKQQQQAKNMTEIFFDMCWGIFFYLVTHKVGLSKTPRNKK